VQNARQAVEKAKGAKGMDVAVSVAAKKGANMAGKKGPAVWLRDGLLQRAQEPNPTVTRVGHPASLPYGNFGCPAATARLAGTAMEAVVRNAITRS
jgi:hypothetical protein